MAFGFAIFISAGSFVTYRIVRFVRDPFGPPEIVREEKPLAVEQARAKNCPILLPDDAKNVQFASFSEFIAYDIMVRFEAPPNEGRDWAQHLVDLDAKEHKQPSTKIRLDPFNPKAMQVSDPQAMDLGPVPWFDTTHITNGVTAIVPIGNYCQIYIDDQRGIFYYLQTD